MKYRQILLCVLSFLSLSLIACSSEPVQASVEVTYDEFIEVKDTVSLHVTESLEVTPGSTITVTLWSNQTTGFKWSEEATIADQSIIQQIEHKYIPPEDEGLVGASGKEVWTFKALKKGTTTVSMEYSQPWEGGEKDAYGFFLTVVIK